MGKQALEEIISMRLTTDDKRLLKKVAERIPMMPRLTIARAALRLGLAALDEDPARVLEQPKRKGRLSA